MSENNKYGVSESYHMRRSVAMLKDELKTERAIKSDLIAALVDAINQIEYLHEKFVATGTDVATISVCRAAIAKAEVR